MVILLLCEPRSGSNNLARWFGLYDTFTVVNEPLNKTSLHYKNGVPVNEWVYNTKHLLIKEIFNKDIDFTPFINIADKLVLLYRENKVEQTESWLVASETNSWTKQWKVNDAKITNEEFKRHYLNNLFEGFKKNYLDNPKLFKITYEELYYNGGIQKLIDYITLNELENKNFPYGERYRVENLKPNRLI